MKQAHIIIAVIVISAALLYLYPISNLVPGSIVSISEIKYGQISNGQITGGKYVISATLSQAGDTLQMKLRNATLTWGQYKVMPEKNIAIKMESTGSYAISTLYNYDKSYGFHPINGVLIVPNTQLGNSWNYYTPYKISIYADKTSNPTTLISSTTIDGLTNDWTPIGNDIAIQQTSIAFLGPASLPSASDIVVSTSPMYTDLSSKVNYNSGASYVFLRSSFDSKTTFFKDSITVLTFNDPLMVLWSGYDKYSALSLTTQCSGITGYYLQTNGYCKINGWYGLPTEATKAPSIVSFDSATNKIKANGIQYSSNVILEVPTELAESFVVLIGVGKPVITDFYVPPATREGSEESVSVTVRNDGDQDGFNVQFSSRSGKLIFSPNSYNSVPISQRQTQKFESKLTTAGYSTYNSQSKEDIIVVVRANHNPASVTASKSTNIEYKVPVPGETTPKPSGTPVTSVNGTDGVSTTVSQKAWYEKSGFVLLLIFTTLLIAGLYYFNMSKKGK